MIADAPPLGSFRASDGIYSLTFRDLDLTLEVDRLRAERSGDVTGEVRVVWPEVMPDRTFHQARVTLTGTRSRQDLARYLDARTPKQSKVDWAELLEVLATRTIDRFREGEAPVRLRDIPLPIGSVDLLPQLVVDRHPTIWFGDGGDGKSLLALAAGLSIENGCDLGLGRPARRTPVLFCDFEFSGEDHRARMERIIGPDQRDLLYLRCDMPLVAEEDRIRRYIRDNGIGFLVIDSVAAACNGSPSEPEVAGEFSRAVRRIGRPSLWIAHQTKAEDGDKKPFGSVAWFNAARSVWYFKASEAASDDRLSVALFNRKANLTRRLAPIGVDVRFGPDRTEIRRTEITAPDLLARVPLWRRVRDEVSTGPKPYHELASILGEPVDSVSKAVRRLEGKVFHLVELQGVRQVALLEHRAQ